MGGYKVLRCCCPHPCRCVIAEMFSDGRQVFDLSHLLEYRRQQLRPPLRWIKNEDIRVGRHACLSCDSHVMWLSCHDGSMTTVAVSHWLVGVTVM